MADINLLRRIGKVTWFEKNHMLLAGMPIGKFFGEMSVIDGWPRSASIISEDESAALAIDKNNFGQLIESSPEMGWAMLKTLSDRANSTAETVRSSGKPVPDLPENLRNPTQQDAKTTHTHMIMLAQRIRELNEMLLAKEGEMLRNGL